MRRRSTWTDPRRLARALGITLVIGSMYLALTAAVLLVSLMLLQRGVTPDLPWILTVQRHLYFAGARNIWPAQPACVAFDEELIYRPRLGTCRFENPEFRTVQTFSQEGRDTGPKPPGVGIAVVGDSHAMGWGVNDEETFSAELQKLIGRPVYNLAVSSYGTVRELRWLERSGLLDRIDTVVIQYCENDVDENVNFRATSVDETRKKFSRIGQAASGRKDALGSVGYLYQEFWFAFGAPLTSLREHMVGRKPLSFAGHYEPLIAAISQHNALSSKRVLVFYSNPYGTPFSGFPLGPDPRLANVEFVDLGLVRADYYRVDDHLTREGHKKAGRRLSSILEARARPKTGGMKH